MPYRQHIVAANDLVTPLQVIPGGFLNQATRKREKASEYITPALTLSNLAAQAATPQDLAAVPGIASYLWTAAGLSEKALAWLDAAQRQAAVNALINDHLVPAGASFRDALVARFLLVQGDSLGGSMRNEGGAIGKTIFVQGMLTALTNLNRNYLWLRSGSRNWQQGNGTEDPDVVNGLHWMRNNNNRTLVFNRLVPWAENKNVDLALFSVDPPALRTRATFSNPFNYLALGEIKGGIDPAGADEHWKTANTALNRIRAGAAAQNTNVRTFFLGAAIVNTQSATIWTHLTQGLLTNAANLTQPAQVLSLCRWLCGL